MSEKKGIEIVVRGVCVQKGKLLVCRSVRHGHHYLPGGHVEWGETSPEALRREWIEELKVPCKVGDFLGLLEQTYVMDGQEVAEISIVFAVECPDLSPAAAETAEPDNIDFSWIPLDSLDDAKLMPEKISHAIPGWLRPDGTSPKAYLH